MCRLGGGERSWARVMEGESLSREPRWDER